MLDDKVVYKKKFDKMTMLGAMLGVVTVILGVVLVLNFEASRDDQKSIVIDFTDVEYIEMAVEANKDLLSQTTNSAEIAEILNKSLKAPLKCNSDLEIVCNSDIYALRVANKAFLIHKNGVLISTVRLE